MGTPILAILALYPSLGARADAPTVTSGEIVRAMEQTADAQIAALKGRTPTDWTAGTMYVGLEALSHVSANPAYAGAVVAVGDKVGWTIHPLKSDPDHADNYCIGQAFLDAYDTGRDPARIASLKPVLDVYADHLAANAADATAKPTWWWCDALFMAPPLLTKMSAETRDRKYVDAMDKGYWKTAALLYDPAEHLFYRDAHFLNRPDKNGKKVFWARGNGWVFAGLANILRTMPSDYPARPKYVALFRDMAARIAPLQGADGLWRSSLLDPEAFPGPETSGSAFYCYGLAWGIENNLLDRETYLPIVARAWAGLLAARRGDHLVGYAQGVSGAPGLARPDGTQLYATGGFLLAGAELTKLTPFPAAPPPTLVPPPLPPPTPPANVPQPAPGARAFVRYVPERFDDIAWENDRIAHRIFGPALAVHPGDGPESGIDVWVKSTRDMVVNTFYKNGDYHHDHGLGLDCYETGHSRGDGGWGVWDGVKLYNSLDWATYKILQNGPDVAKFQITYAPWDAPGRKVWETRIESLSAGSNLDRIETTIGSDKPDDLIIGIGIARRKGADHLTQDRERGILAYWEPPTRANGTIGCAVLVDPALIVGYAQTADDNLVLVKVTPGKPLVYYTGACWTKGLDFHSENEWLDYLKGYVRN